MKTGLFKMVLALVIFLGVSSCGTTKGNDAMFADIETENYDILTLAATNEDLSIITDLIQRSGLDLQMQFKDNPVTLFLPTDDAFKAMSANQLEDLMDRGNKAELLSILKRHVLPNEVMAYDFNDTQVIDTSGDEELRVTTSPNSDLVYIGGAQILKSVKAKNGVIHVVDKVLQPTADIL